MAGALTHWTLPLTIAIALAGCTGMAPAAVEESTLPAGLVVDSIRASPDPAVAGHPVEVTVAVVNAGAVPATGFVTLWWAGEPLAVVEEVTVAAGGTGAATFKVTPEAAGFVAVAAGFDSVVGVRRTLAVVEPEVEVASWTARDADCRDELALDATVANVGEIDVEDVTLDAWSIDATGRTLGHAAVEIGDLAAGATAPAAAALFAPKACTEPYTLLLVVSAGGEEIARSVTDPFVGA